MAQIPLSEQFIGLSATVNTTERRSSLINSESQAYTMQDVIDTVANALPPSAPKMLIAEIGQSGTSDPYLVSTVVGDITPNLFARYDVGKYVMTFDGGTLTAKTIVTILLDAAIPANATGLVGVSVYWYSDSIQIITKTPSTNALADNLLNNARIQIQVYQ
jgi:hypothetical protein